MLQRRHRRSIVLTVAIGLVIWAVPLARSDEEGGNPAALMLAGEWERAASVCAEIAASSPSAASARACRVRALVQLRRWREALEEARSFAKELPASLEVQTALGEALFRAGLLEEADELLSSIAERAAIATDPTEAARVDAPIRARALVALGRLRDAQGRGREAATYLEHALELAPDDRYVLFRAAGAAPSRAEIVERLECYMEMSEGDDPDRIEAARGKIRLYRALGERRVWQVENQPDRVVLPLSPISDGEGGVVGYTIGVAMGTKKKKPVRLMLDTGSTGLFLLGRIARKRGFEPLAEETVFGGGGKKRHLSSTGIVPSLGVGDLRFSDALATTTGTEIDPLGRFHGLLGLSVFSGYEVRLELGRGRMVLTRDDSTEGEQGGPYWDVAGQMLVKAATSSGDEGLFLLDTGAARSVVSLGLADRSGDGRVGEAVDVRGYGGRLEGSRAIRGLQVVFQGRSTRVPWLNATDFSLRSHIGEVEISGFVGLDLLAGQTIVVDTRNRRVTLSPPEKPPKGRKRK